MLSTLLLGTRRLSDPPTALWYTYGVTLKVRDFERFSKFESHKKINLVHA